MKAFLFSDLHCSIKHLVRMYEFVSSADGKDIKALIFTGDVVNMGEPIWVVEDFIRTLDKINMPFLWVPGNNDFGRAYYKLNAKYKSLEGRIVEMGFPQSGRQITHRFSGVGGSPASWAGQYQGESMVDKKAIAGSVFLSHVPPPGVHNWQKHDIPTLLSPSVILSATKNPAKRNSAFGLDSSPMAQDDNKDINLPRKRLADSPLIHICGHIHHQWGCAYLGQTKLIKLASLETGHYAILDLQDLSVEFKRF